MDLEKIKNAILNAVDSIAKGLGVEMRVLVLILLFYLRWGLSLCLEEVYFKNVNSLFL